MGALAHLIVLAAVLATPLAAAGQLLPAEQVCTPVGCTPRSCEPAMDCRLDVDPTLASCAVNLTISGRTCQTSLGGGVSRRDAGTSLYGGATVSNGSVSALHLQNSWLSPTVGAEGSVAGASFGRTTVGAYRSDILTEGPRGGPFGQVAPYTNHTWTEVGLFVRHDSATAREGVLVAVWFLDLMPDGCFVRTHSGVDDTPCPSIAAAWNYVPLP